MEITIVIILSALIIHGVVEIGRTLCKGARLDHASPCPRSHMWFFAASLIAGTLQITCGTVGLALYVLMELLLSRFIPSGLALLVGSIPLWPGLGTVFLQIICFPEQVFRLTGGSEPIAKGPVFLWTIRTIGICFIVACVVFEYLTLTALWK